MSSVLMLNKQMDLRTKMITANEAKKLYEKSGQEVEDFLTYKVEGEVIKAANGGKRQTCIFLDSLNIFDHLDQKITPLQKAVVDKLKGLGYSAAIKQYGERYVPRGLADDDGKGPSPHQNYGIIISW
jgi:hypothetical protein